MSPHTLNDKPHQHFIMLIIIITDNVFFFFFFFINIFKNCVRIILAFTLIRLEFNISLCLPVRH